MAAPSVYAAIHAIAADLATAGIPKAHTNVVDQYVYRSIDDVLNRLAPLLAKHRLCVLPRALERSVTERTSTNQELLIAVTVRAEFTLVSVDDGSAHAVESYGEALDGGDKATAKAMSAAYKAAMIQTFCIPVPGSEDADAETMRTLGRTHAPQPVEGWQQWVRDIADIIGVCESAQAIDLVQERNRALLKALSREQPDAYALLGEVFTARRAVLRERGAQESASPKAAKPKRGRKNEARAPEPVDR
jgi:ERF superfamily